jgi:hypothetical protein
MEMGFFSKMFGWDDAKKAAINEEINIMDAINAHVRWKIRLDKCLHGTSEEKLDHTIVCRDDQCVLGKWIHGPAEKFFHDDDSLKVLRDDHAKFHQLAGRIVELVQTNDKDTAEKLLNGEYTEASRIVIRDLTELSKHLVNRL